MMCTELICNDQFVLDNLECFVKKDIEACCGGNRLKLVEECTYIYIYKYVYIYTLGGRGE